MEFRQIFIRNLGITGIIVLALTALILFLGKDISGRAGKIQNQRRELSVRLQSLESLASLRANSERANKIFDAIQGMLPLKDQLIGFSKNLESLAKSNQLGFGFKFESEIPSTETQPGINSFILTTSGSYSNFTRFLKGVEEGKYFVGFNSFDILKKDKDFQMLIKGKVFSQ